MKNNLILMSIKPIHAKKIFNGEKSVELRRKLPKSLKKGDLIIVYVSSPQQNLYGAFSVKRILSLTPMKLWKKVYKDACVEKSEFFKYFSTVEVGHGIVIEKYWQFDEPIGLKKIKSHNTDFCIPQNYRYLKENDFNLIQTEVSLVF